MNTESNFVHEDSLILKEPNCGKFASISCERKFNQRLFELLIEVDVTRTLENNQLDYKSLLKDGMSFLTED